jgi:hypothetical protein
VLIQPPPEPGMGEHVYLADFGLTKHTQSRSGITHTGQFLGTPDYVAPEQIQDRQVDARVDIYALGCLTYELLTNQVPYPRSSEAAVLWAHMQDPFPRARDLRPELPQAVDDAIGRATAKDPEDRYGDALELSGDLRAALAAPQREPARTPVPTPPEPVQPAPRAFAPPAELVAPPPPAAQPPGGRRRRPSPLVGGLVLVIVALVAALVATYLANGGQASDAGPGSTAQGKTNGPTSPSSGFPPNTTALQLVMDHRLLRNCSDAAPMPAGAVESISCTPPNRVITYQVTLYRSTAELERAFGRLLSAHDITRRPDPAVCRTSADSRWSGYFGNWYHPQTGAVREVGGERACYATPEGVSVMVWTHKRTNRPGNVQPNHYDTLVTAEENDPFPVRLLYFWKRAQIIGRALPTSGEQLPPLPS